MIIDIILIILLIFSIIKGLRRGLVVAVFSIVAFIVGLAAAIKLSVVVAAYLKNSVNVSAQLLPVISFALVFLIVVILIRIGAKLIEKAVEAVMLGWANRIAGAVLYAGLYTFIFSVLLFFATQIKFINDSTINESKTYSYIKPLGPLVIENTGKIIPWFKNMFIELEDFFGRFSTQHPE